MSQVVTRIAPLLLDPCTSGQREQLYLTGCMHAEEMESFISELRIQTEKESTPEATEVILNGLNWLGLDYDDEIVSQFERAPRHIEIAHTLLKNGKAYKCFSTSDEIQEFKDAARKKGTSTLFKSPWRDADPSTHPNSSYVIRIKSPENGETIVKDEVQGEVTFKNNQLDDMVLLRSDGSPVYMLAVVVDDYDMGVTHVIREMIT